MEALKGKSLNEKIEILLQNQLNILIPFYFHIYIIYNYSKNLKNERVTPNHWGMPPLIKVLLMHALLVFICLNDVSGEEVSNAGNDQLLSVRSIRNWVR